MITYTEYQEALQKVLLYHKQVQDKAQEILNPKPLHELAIGDSIVFTKVLGDNKKISLYQEYKIIDAEDATNREEWSDFRFSFIDDSGKIRRFNKRKQGYVFYIVNSRTTPEY